MALSKRDEHTIGTPQHEHSEKRVRKCAHELRILIQRITRNNSWQRKQWQRLFWFTQASHGIENRITERLAWLDTINPAIGVKMHRHQHEKGPDAGQG